MTFPKCPHCKHVFNSEEIWFSGSTVFPTENDGDITESFCLSCKEPLKIELSLTPEWHFLDDDYERID